MRVLLLMIAALALPASATARTERLDPCSHALTWQQAAASVGKTVSVMTRVLGAKHVMWKSGKGEMTFLDTGRKYPAHGLTLVVWNRDVESLSGALVCARGKVTVYNGAPEMSVDTPAALRRA